MLFRSPTVLQGHAQVLRDGAFWRVTADGGKELTLEMHAMAAAPGGMSSSAHQFTSGTP